VNTEKESHTLCESHKAGKYNTFTLSPDKILAITMSKHKTKKENNEKTNQREEVWPILANSSICQRIQANFALKLHSVNNSFEP